MGAAVSTNIIDITAKAMAKVSTNIIQKTQLTTDTNQIISVSDVDGDVYIIGNTFYQRASINVQALMNAISSQDAQQEMLLNLVQEAKSMISGLNLVQIADASNTMRVLMQVCINMTTNIIQTCAQTLKENQEIIVKRVKGNVYVQNNVFDQMANLIYKCAQNAASYEKAIQDLEAKLDQKAEAKAEGLSPWVLAALLLIVLGVPVGGAAFAGTKALKYIFPIIAITGVVLLIIYAVWSKDGMKHYAYSTFISNQPLCRAVQAGPPTTNYKNVVEASDACLSSKSCAAFDFQSLNPSDLTPLNPPMTTFYTTVDPGCAKTIGKDNVPVVNSPRIYTGPNDPAQLAQVASFNPGDAYINFATGDMFKYESGKWVFVGNVMKGIRFDHLYVVDMIPVKPPQDVSLENYTIYYNKNAPQTLRLYKYDPSDRSWLDTGKLVPGPGFVSNPPAATNVSGFKTLDRRDELLYIGIVGLIIGLVGTIAAYKYATFEQQPS